MSRIISYKIDQILYNLISNYSHQLNYKNVWGQLAFFYSSLSIYLRADKTYDSSPYYSIIFKTPQILEYYKTTSKQSDEQLEKHYFLQDAFIIIRRLCDYPRADSDAEENNKLMLKIIEEVGYGKLCMDNLGDNHLAEGCLSLITDFTYVWENSVYEIKNLNPDFFVKLQQIYISSSQNSNMRKQVLTLLINCTVRNQEFCVYILKSSWMTAILSEMANLHQEFREAALYILGNLIIFLEEDRDINVLLNYDVVGQLINRLQKETKCNFSYLVLGIF